MVGVVKFWFGYDKVDCGSLILFWEVFEDVFCVFFVEVLCCYLEYVVLCWNVIYFEVSLCE